MDTRRHSHEAARDFVEVRRGAAGPRIAEFASVSRAGLSCLTDAACCDGSNRCRSARHGKRILMSRSSRGCSGLFLGWPS